MIMGLVAAVVGSMLMTGCASMLTSDDFEVQVESIPPHVECALENDEGRYLVSDTPSRVIVHKSCSPLQVLCSLNGYEDVEEVVAPGNAGMAWANAGLLFVGAYGYMLDRDTGAACSYPKEIIVNFTK